MVYVAFVSGVFARRILGWRAATAMTTPLVLDCLEQAIWTRRCEGTRDLAGLVHHPTRGRNIRRLRSPAAWPGRHRPVRRVGRRRLRQRPGRIADRPVQDRAVPSARSLARPGPPRASDPGLGHLVQYRTPPRIRRRLHPGRRRAPALSLPGQPRPGWLTTKPSLQNHRGGSIQPTGVPPTFRTADPLGSSPERTEIMAGKYRKFSPEFREGAARMVVETSRAIADVARELGDQRDVASNWVRAYREQHAEHEPPLEVSERARLRELERLTASWKWRTRS